jgi:hypothetical protein
VLSAKEWASLKRAIARAPALQEQCMGVDGKVGIPRGWVKLEGGGGFVCSASGAACGSISEVLEVLERAGE